MVTSEITVSIHSHLPDAIRSECLSVRLEAINDDENDDDDENKKTIENTKFNKHEIKNGNKTINNKNNNNKNNNNVSFDNDTDSTSVTSIATDNDNEYDNAFNRNFYEKTALNMSNTQQVNITGNPNKHKRSYSNPTALPPKKELFYKRHQSIPNNNNNNNNNEMYKLKDSLTSLSSTNTNLSRNSIRKLKESSKRESIISLGRLEKFSHIREASRFNRQAIDMGELIEYSDKGLLQTDKSIPQPHSSALICRFPLKKKFSLASVVNKFTLPSVDDDEDEDDGDDISRNNDDVGNGGGDDEGGDDEGGDDVVVVRGGSMDVQPQANQFVLKHVFKKTKTYKVTQMNLMMDHVVFSQPIGVDLFKEDFDWVVRVRDKPMSVGVEGINKVFAGSEEKLTMVVIIFKDSSDDTPDVTFLEERLRDLRVLSPENLKVITDYNNNKSEIGVDRDEEDGSIDNDDNTNTYKNGNNNVNSNNDNNNNGNNNNGSNNNDNNNNENNNNDNNNNTFTKETFNCVRLEDEAITDILREFKEKNNKDSNVNNNNNNNNKNGGKYLEFRLKLIVLLPLHQWLDKKNMSTKLTITCQHYSQCHVVTTFHKPFFLRHTIITHHQQKYLQVVIESKHVTRMRLDGWSLSDVSDHHSNPTIIPPSQNHLRHMILPQRKKVFLAWKLPDVLIEQPIISLSFCFSYTVLDDTQPKLIEKEAQTLQYPINFHDIKTRYVTSFEIETPEEATVGEWIYGHVLVKQLCKPIGVEQNEPIIDHESTNKQEIINYSTIHQPIMSYFKNKGPICDDPNYNQPIETKEEQTSDTVKSDLDSTLSYKLEFKKDSWCIKGRHEGEITFTTSKKTEINNEEKRDINEGFVFRGKVSMKALKSGNLRLPSITLRLNGDNKDDKNNNDINNQNNKKKQKGLRHPLENSETLFDTTRAHSKSYKSNKDNDIIKSDNVREIDINVKDKNKLEQSWVYDESRFVSVAVKAREVVPTYLINVCPVNASVDKGDNDDNKESIDNQQSNLITVR